MKYLIFPNELKRVNVSLMYKKHCHDKSNHRPVNVLTLLSKPFEHSLFEQIDNNIKDTFMVWGRTGKKFSSQHSLLVMFE